MNKKTLIKFLTLQFFYLVASAAIFSYATALFQNAGIAVDRITSSCSVETACSFVGMFVLGAFCSKIGKIKFPLVAFLLVSVGIYTVLFFFTDNPLLPLVYGVMGFVFDPVTALIDSWILNAGGDEAKSFSKIRTASLFVYALFYIVLGLLIDAYSYKVCLITVYVALGVCILVALTLSDVEKPQGSDRAVEPSLPFKETLKAEIGYLGVIPVIAFLSGLCCTSLLSYVPMILTEIDGGAFYQGLGLFLCYVGNSLCSLSQVKFGKTNYLRRFEIGAACMIVALLSVTVARNIGTLLFSNFMRGVADAFVIVTFREYVNKVVPGKLKTFSQSMCNAFYGSLGGAVGMFVTGLLYAPYGLNGMTFFCMAAGVACVVVCEITLLSKRGRRYDNKN